MYLQYFNPAADIRPSNNDLPVKSARSKEGRVEDIGPVCGSDKNDSFRGFKSIHLNKELVKCLFTLVMSAAKTGAAKTSDCINFINEYYTWCILLSLIKKVPH